MLPCLPAPTGEGTRYSVKSLSLSVIQLLPASAASVTSLPSWLCFQPDQTVLGFPQTPSLLPTLHRCPGACSQVTYLLCFIPCIYHSLFKPACIHLSAPFCSAHAPSFLHWNTDSFLFLFFSAPSLPSFDFVKYHVLSWNAQLLMCSYLLQVYL